MSEDRAADLDLEELPVPSVPQWDFSRFRGHPPLALLCLFLSDRHLISQTRPHWRLIEKVLLKGVCAPLSQQLCQDRPSRWKLRLRLADVQVTQLGDSRAQP